MSPPEKTGYTHHVPAPCDEQVDVLYSDDHLLVVVKPAGLLSVPGRFIKDCVLHRMLFEHPDARIVHRLDLDTSGVMVLAKSDLAVRDLNRQFRERVVRKEYVALVWGELGEQSGEIDLPLRPDPDNRPRQVVDQLNGKQAFTRYERLESKDAMSKVLLMPVTGRSHQLRLHMAAIGHPILGCDLYANQQAFEAADRLCLHASRLQLQHPVTRNVVTFESRVPWEA